MPREEEQPRPQEWLFSVTSDVPYGHFVHPLRTTDKALFVQAAGSKGKVRPAP